ncbi:Soluble guanylate cyclase 88E, partial [Tetrabaena socialis]
HAVTLVDRDGRVLLANAASGGMWGGRVEAGSEERLLSLLFSHDPAALTEAMAALDQGSTWRGLLPVPLGQPPAAAASSIAAPSGRDPPPAELPAGAARIALSAPQVSFLPADAFPSPLHSKDPHVRPGRGDARPVAHGPVEPRAQPPPTPATSAPGSATSPVEYAGPGGMQAQHGPDATAGSTDPQPAPAAAATQGGRPETVVGVAACGQEPGGHALNGPRAVESSSSLQQRRRVVRRRHSVAVLGYGADSTHTDIAAVGLLEELAAAGVRLPAGLPKEPPPAGAGASNATTRPAVADVPARAPVRRTVSVMALGEAEAAGHATVRQQLLAGLQLSAWGPALMRGHQPPRTQPQPGPQRHRDHQQPLDPPSLLGRNLSGAVAAMGAAGAAHSASAALQHGRSGGSWSDQYASCNHGREAAAAPAARPRSRAALPPRLPLLPENHKAGHLVGLLPAEGLAAAAATAAFTSAAATAAAGVDAAAAAAAVEEEEGDGTFLGLSSNSLPLEPVEPHISLSSGGESAGGRGDHGGSRGGGGPDGPMSDPPKPQAHGSHLDSGSHLQGAAAAAVRLTSASVRNLSACAGPFGGGSGAGGRGGGTGSAVLSSGGAGSGVMGRLLSITLQSVSRGAGGGTRTPPATAVARQRTASFHLSDLGRIHELHGHEGHRQQRRPLLDAGVSDLVLGRMPVAAAVTDPTIGGGGPGGASGAGAPAMGGTDSGGKRLVDSARSKSATEKGPANVGLRPAELWLEGDGSTGASSNGESRHVPLLQPPSRNLQQRAQLGQRQQQARDDSGGMGPGAPAPNSSRPPLPTTVQLPLGDMLRGGDDSLRGGNACSTEPFPAIMTMSAVLSPAMNLGAVAAAEAPLLPCRASGLPSGFPASEVAPSSRMRYSAVVVLPQPEPARFPPQSLPSTRLAATLSPVPRPTAVAAGEAAVQWHEVALTPLIYTGTTPPRPAVLIVQNDVSSRIWAERQLARVVEAEHTLLENIFPHHVIEHIAVTISAATSAAEGPSKTDGVASASDVRLHAKLLSGIRTSAEAGGPGGPACSGRLSGVGALGGADAQSIPRLPAIRGDTFEHLATSHTAITILFCDIQGFTPMCSQMQPVVVMSFLNDLFTRLDGLLDEYGVYKVETIGDCYVAAGGLMRVDEETGAVTVRSDDVDPQHANSTVQFAKALLRAASRVSLPTTGQPVRLRVGIHSGAAMSGVVGTRMPRFCLFGDTMNVASRMESTGEAGAIHVSQATRDLVPHEAWESRGGMEVKGKGIMETRPEQPAIFIPYHYDVLNDSYFRSKAKPASGAKRSQGKFLSRKDEAIQYFLRETFVESDFLAGFASESALDQARHDLTQLNEYCKQEVQKVVHNHHKDFLEASRDIQDVEGLVDELRNYVSGSAAVVANLVDMPALAAKGSAASESPAGLVVAADDPSQPQQPLTAWAGIRALQAELLQDLQVAVRERDYPTARELLAAGRDVVAVVDRDSVVLAEQAGGDSALPAWRHSLEAALAAQKAALVGDLTTALTHTNSSTMERRYAAQVLGSLVGPGQAAQALLRCHTRRLRAAQLHLLQQHSALLRAASRVSLPTTGEPVRMRVGIHSGAAMSGVVGTRMPRFCLFGDTMNVASRMESTGEAGAIHVSQATRDLVPHEAWESRGGMEVKGKGIMETYLLRA